MTEADRKLRATPLHVLSPAPRPWNICGAWNIAVRTSPLFTHRDYFQKPACVERGLVRTGGSYLLRI